MKRTSTSAYLTVLVIAITLVVVCYGLGDTRTTLLIGALLAYLTRPMTLRLEAKGVPRWVAITGVFVVAVAVVLIVLLVALPPLSRELQDFIAMLPSKIESGLQGLQSLATRLDIELPVHLDELRTLVQQSLSGISLDWIQAASPFLKQTFSNIFQILFVFLNVILVPLFYAYIAYSYEDIRKQFRDIIPIGMRQMFQHVGARVDEIIYGYMYGQFLVAVILAVFYGGGLYLVGLKFGVLIGVITGLLVVIPYFGYALGLCAGLMMELTHFSGWGHFALVGLVFAVGQALESAVITPRFVGRQVGLHPLIAIIALLVGGNLFGFIGLLISVPAAAVLKEGFEVMLRQYQKSSLYLD